jgi:hypothetical protein
LSRLSRAATRIVLWLIVICGVAAILFHSAGLCIDAPTYHIDGAFQTASALYRLAAGRLPGRDFLPYLGIGPALLLYPLFAAAGAHLAASVFSAHVVALLSAALCAGVTYRFLAGKRGWLSALAFGFLLVTLVIFYKTTWKILPDVFVDRFYPGHSLRAIRMTLPYLIAALAYAALRIFSGGRRLYVAWGLIAGLCFVWSNDYAWATYASFSAFVLWHAVHRREAGLGNAAAFLVASIGHGLLLLILSTGGGFLSLLAYNFRDVARDQWWYFGPWGVRGRIFSIADLAMAAQSYEAPMRGLPVLLLLGLLLYRRPTAPLALLLFIGAVVKSLFLCECLTREHRAPVVHAAAA